MMIESKDLSRLRKEYSKRAIKYKDSLRYTVFNEANLFLIQMRERAVIKALKKNNFFPLSKYDIFEMGSGGGGVLIEFLRWGASYKRLYGADLLFDRVQVSSKVLPGSSVVCANGEYIPFRNSSFDLALQFTAYSSILDYRVKQNIAQEMLRVLRPQGAIIWYDFWVNPKNKETRGILLGEIRELFPNCTYSFEKVTLAPPLARLMVRVSWNIAYLLEKLRAFNTHYLAVIKPI